MKEQSLGKVLITGATGFIGGYLVKHFLARQVQIRVLVRDFSKAVFPDEVEIFYGDLIKPDSLLGVCDDIDTVFHLGGYAHAWGESNSNFSDKHRVINFHGAENIAVEAAQAGVKRFVFFSSVKAVADSEEYVDESWTDLSDSPYGLAKRNAENAILKLKETANMHVSVLRLPAVYGPYWKGNLANMLQAIDRGVFPPLPKISNSRSMISVKDACQAAVLAATDVNASGKIYFVTDGVAYSTYQVYTLMLQALGKKIPKWYIPTIVFKFLSWMGDLGHRLTGRRMPFNSDAMDKLFGSAHYNSQRIKDELGFTPSCDLQNLLPEIVTVYKQDR